VTESLMMDNLQHSIDTLQALRDRDITLALDDFGTGYSSLSYLRRFPINTLKIDQSFVQNVLSDPGDAAITKTIIALAQNLQLNITAEGVETQEQFEYIKAQGCDEIQGYYFSRPILADHLADLLQNGANLSKQSTVVNS
jgi:EAL domain-containing protein (putative c-di-GMP-specific phosphodiesterase class I)